MYGLIFLFKYNAGEAPSAPVSDDVNGNGVFFASQVIQNACATQAILSILMNCPDTVALGDTLSNLKGFTEDFDADLKGMAIGNSETIRDAHNSFARPEPIVAENSAPSKDDEAFHFVAYVPVNGRLFELDGLKRGPIDHGEIGDTSTWLDKVCPVIRARIEKYAASEIRFNLMALVRNKKDVLLEKIANAQRANQSTDEMQNHLANETECQQTWRDENIRRRHNYIPFMFNALTVLAEQNKLDALLEKTKR